MLRAGHTGTGPPRLHLDTPRSGANRGRFRLRDSRSVACESGCVVRCSSSELVGVPTAPFLEAARGPQPSVPCLNLAWAAEFGDGQSFLKASFTFSPACLRLLTPCSVLPSRSICSSPLALPTCSLAAPLASSFLLFSFSSQPITGLLSFSVGRWRLRAGWIVVTVRGGTAGSVVVLAPADGTAHAAQDRQDHADDQQDDADGHEHGETLHE